MRELITVIIAKSNDPVYNHEGDLKKGQDHMGHKLAHCHLEIGAVQTAWFLFFL